MSRPASIDDTRSKSAWMKLAASWLGPMVPLALSPWPTAADSLSVSRRAFLYLPGRRPMPAKNGAVSIGVVRGPGGSSGLSNRARSGLVRPHEVGEDSKERVRPRPGRATMGSDGPAGQPGQVEWQIVGERKAAR